MSSARHVDIEGIHVEPLRSPHELFAWVLDALRGSRRRVVLHLNVHGANLAHADPGLREAYAHADLVYCDGAGVVLASRLLGTPLPTRLTAADWLEELLRQLAAAGRTAFFLAGAPGVADAALARFDRTVPGHTVVGVHHGYVLEDPALERAVLSRINQLKPDVLFVGLGMPLQERWIERHRAELDVGVFWALGATLDYLTGRVGRVPRWLGDAGLEWLYRLTQEPRRLFGRYVLGNPRFVARILRRAWRSRSGAAP